MSNVQHVRVMKKMAAQGELCLKKVERIPEGFQKVDPKNGQYIVGHSETGHHHILDATPEVELFRDPQNEFFQYLRITPKNAEVFESETANGAETVSLTDALPPAVLRHLRDHDTHDPVGIPYGTYRISTERRWTPDGLRKVED